MEDVEDQARSRGVDLFVLPTAEALEELERAPEDANAILHVTC